MPEFPSPGDLADAGGWAVFAALAIAVIVGLFWLLRQLWRREFERSDELKGELRDANRRIADLEDDALDLAAENRRLRDLLGTYGTSDERLARPRRPRRRRNG